jgi:hypothetical protein
MKKIVVILIVISIALSCKTTTKAIKNDSNSLQKVSDTVRIANDEIQYEVIIIDPGFNSFLYGQAKPRGFYSELYLESRNQIYVIEWNNRVMQPQRFNPNLYEMRIDYDPNIHYGYEVNYLMYNYFIYFQLNYKQQLSGFVPRN